MQYNSESLKITAGAWRSCNDHTVYGPDGNVVADTSISVTDRHAAGTRSEAEALANEKAIGEVPRLIQALAMLLTAVRDSRAPNIDPAATFAAARALRRVTGVDQTPTVTREIAEIMQASFNEGGTP